MTNPTILPSWNDTAAKHTILDYVRRVTDPACPDYVPLPRRIATFDHDGTLWCEKPVYVQMNFILNSLKERVEGVPALAENPTIRALLLDNLAAVHSVTIAQFLDMVTTIAKGPSPDEYEADVTEWLAHAVHPRFNVPYTQLIYQPMRELLAYLRSNGFTTTICSGGGIEFVRAIAEDLYGVPRECVIGTAINYEMREHEGRPVLERESSLYGPINEGPGKSINIQMHLGRQPILAVGNSSGDIEMLRMAQAGKEPSLCLMVNHDDAVREYAYDGRSSTVNMHESAVDTAHRYGWTVVSMKSDWKKVFGFEGR